MQLFQNIHGSRLYTSLFPEAVDELSNLPNHTPTIHPLPAEGHKQLKNKNATKIITWKLN